MNGYDDASDYVPLPEKKRPGRQCLIVDSTLQHNRDDLLFILETAWSDFCFELKKARTLPALREALSLVGKHKELEVFTETDSKQATLPELRRNRDEEKLLSNRLRKALKENRECEESLEQAMHVKSTSKEGEQFYEEYSKEHKWIQNLINELNFKLGSLRDVIRKQEARIAQSELLQFLVEKRYSVTPLSLSNAMAGLPYISYRHSIARCRKHPAIHSGEFEYEMFCHLQRAFAKPPRNAEDAENAIWKYLTRSKHKRKPVIVRLGQDWYYLKNAIGSAYSQQGRNKKPIANRVCSDFRKRISSRSLFDELRKKKTNFDTARVE